MRVTYVTAGAAGMICGSCLRDNALTHELRALDCDVLLVPVYTPIRTDVENASEQELLFGGISVYLEQKSGLFRKLPRFLTGWLDRPGIIRRLSAKNSIEVEAEQLGELTLSMLRGENGNQRREVKRCISWIRQRARPDLVNLSNLLIAGFVPALKRELDVPGLVTLQGDDLFLEDGLELRRPEQRILVVGKQDDDVGLAAAARSGDSRGAGVVVKTSGGRRRESDCYACS